MEAPTSRARQETLGQPDTVFLDSRNFSSFAIRIYSEREDRGCVMSDLSNGTTGAARLERQEEPTQKGRAMVRCAESGEAVPTGIRIDAPSLKAKAASTKTTFKCAHCSQEHTWSPKDAWIENLP